MGSRMGDYFRIFRRVGEVLVVNGVRHDGIGVEKGFGMLLRWLWKPFNAVLRSTLAYCEQHWRWFASQIRMWLTKSILLHAHP